MLLYPNSSTIPEDCQIVETTQKMEWRKALSLVVADGYMHTPYTHIANAMRGCSEYIVVRRYDAADKIETAYTQYCGARLCPICAHRRSLKSFWQLSRILDSLDSQRAAEGRAPYAYVLVTLTIENVPGPALEEAVTRIQEGYTRMQRSRSWAAAFKGCWRTMEITYNAERDTYHPHLHCFLAVNQSYFTDKTYLSQRRITALWQRSARLPYTPIVDVRRVKDLGSGKAEVSKYLTKPTSLFEMLPTLKTSEILCYLTDATLFRKSYITYGCIRQTARALHLSDEDGQLLDPTDGDEQLAAALRPECEYVYQLLRYDTASFQYVTTPLYTSREIASLPPRERYMQRRLAGFKLQQDLDDGSRLPETVTWEDNINLRAAYPKDKGTQPEQEESEQVFDGIPPIKTFDPYNLD